MTTENLGLFKAMSAKMDYLDQKQRVISQNIANSDTPGYQARKLTEVDFGRVVQKVINENKLRPETTDSLHMPSPNDLRDPKNREAKVTYEVAPAGNAVIVEEQMINASRTTMDYNLMTTLYQKNVGMIRTALGRQQ